MARSIGLRLKLGERSTRQAKTLITRIALRIATRFALIRGRKLSRARIRRLPCRRILVVCYGNIYRSPLAAELMRSSFRRIKGIEVRSAGFHPRVDRLVPKEFAMRLKERGLIDICGHRSQMVTRREIEWADMVVIMDRHNWHATALLAPDHLGKVIWLGAFVGSGEIEIADPYGCTESQVDAVIESISNAVTGFANQLGFVDHATRPHPGMEIPK